MQRACLLAAVAALAGCIGAAPVDETESGLSVCAKGPIVKGVDVSHYDGTIDWAAVHGAGIAFAFMKATESTGFSDPQFAANWKGAGANGVIRGAYHFFRASADATAQADYFVQQAGVPAAGDLPLTIDLETLDGVAAATVASDALTFLARVETKSGRKPIVYTSASFLSSIGSPAGFGAYTLWVANWQVSCPKLPSPPWSDWTFWQDSATATVNGIPASAVDSDQFNGTLAELQAFAGGGGAVMVAAVAAAAAIPESAATAATTAANRMRPATTWARPTPRLTAAAAWSRAAMRRRRSGSSSPQRRH